MTALWISISAATILFLILFYKLFSLNRKLVRRLATHEARINSQQVSINGLTAGAIGVDRRLRNIEEREQAIEHRQESIESQQELGEAPYGEAIRLVQQGASAQRLVDELGLSQSEADLISMIHGGR